MGAEADEWRGILPRGRWARLVVAFLAVWIWSTGVPTLVSVSFRFLWSFYAVFSLVYLLLFGVTAAYWMHRWRKLSLLAYILGAWAATVPLDLLFLMTPSPDAVVSILGLATGGGLIAYLIVERTWPKSQRQCTLPGHRRVIDRVRGLLRGVGLSYTRD